MYSTLWIKEEEEEVKSGIKVFNGEENSEEGGSEGFQVFSTMKGNQNDGVSGKSKTWRSQSFEGINRSPIHISQDLSKKDFLMNFVGSLVSLLMEVKKAQLI